MTASAVKGNGRNLSGKHRARFLPEKALHRCGPLRTREEKVVDRGQAWPLAGVVESSPLMVPQREIPMASLSMSTGALADLGELGRLRLQPVLLSRIPLTPHPTRYKQGCTHALRTLPQWCAFPDSLGGSDTCEIVRGNAMRLHGRGRGRRSCQWPHLLSHIPRDDLHGRLPLRNP